MTFNILMNVFMHFVIICFNKKYFPYPAMSKINLALFNSLIEIKLSRYIVFT